MVAHHVHIVRYRSQNIEAIVLKWVMTKVEILNIQGSQMLRLYCICTAMYIGRHADVQLCVCHVVKGRCCLLQYYWCQAVHSVSLSVAVSLVPGCTFYLSVCCSITGARLYINL